MVRACRLTSRIVVTGSGMFSLLSAIRHARVNGFALWDATRHVSLGRTPPAAAALAMASRIVDARSVNWPAGVRAAATAPRIVHELATDGPFRDYTSPRPALVAYTVGLVQVQHSGSAVDPLKNAMAFVMLKLETESNRDTATALTLLQRYEVRQLHAIAAASTPQRLQETLSSVTVPLNTLLPYLSEDSGTLLPPYGALIKDWTTSDGELAVTILPDVLALSHVTCANLVTLENHRAPLHGKRILVSSMLAISTAVLASLADNGIGVALPPPARGVRPPTSHQEALAHVPVISAVLAELNMESQRNKGKECSSLSHARKATAADASRLGWDFLMWLRHLQAHVWFGATSLGRTTELTPGVAAAAVRAAVEALVSAQSEFVLNDSGILV